MEEIAFPLKKTKKEGTPTLHENIFATLILLASQNASA